MNSIITYDPKYESLTHMPEGILPPETLYRFEPESKLVLAKL